MSWRAGNASEDGHANRGWFIGSFIGDALRGTEDVELKWGEHARGERRLAWAEGDARSSASILVSGRFRIELADGSVVLERPGDYLIWGPGVGHTWEAEEDSVVLTVRWPSAGP